METPPRRRWLRFSLRGLLVVVTALALWLGWNVYVVRERKAMFAELREIPGVMVYPVSELRAAMPSLDSFPHPPFATVSRFRELLGDAPVQAILFAREPTPNPTDIARARGMFPEANVSDKNYPGLLNFFPK